MLEIVGSFISIHDVLKSLEANYQFSFESAARTLLQEKKEKTKENKSMQVLKFIRELKHTEPEARKFTRDKYNRMLSEWGLEPVVFNEKAYITTYAITAGESDIELTPKLSDLTEWDDESETLGVCILYALANPGLASKAQALTSHWFPTQVVIEGLEYADFVELSKKYGFDREKILGFSCVTRGVSLSVKRQQGKDKIEHPEEFARLIKKPKETPDNRRRRRLKRLREFGGDYQNIDGTYQTVGRNGALADLIREEKANGSPMAGDKEVREDLKKARKEEEKEEVEAASKRSH